MFLINNYYKIFIGCEIHIKCNINKIFSINKKNIYDIGYIGILPLFNFNILKIIFLLSNILISKCFFLSIIERKNYFYFDLSKNYQLTQNNFQFLFNIVLINKCFKKIVIKKIHFEEDASSSKKKKNIIYINYDRSGNSLLELVTEPMFNNIKCLLFFLKKIKKKMIINNVSNLNMYLGEMRVDLNLSIINLFNNKKTKKIEIKNLNSFDTIKKSVKYEFYRQILNLEYNISCFSQTRSYYNNYTFKLRKKSSSKNYNYIIDYDFGYLLFFDFQIINKKKKNFLFLKFPNKKFNVKNKNFLIKNKYKINFNFFYNIYRKIKKYKFFFLFFNKFQKKISKIKKKFFFNF
ncbi:hypothetical protein ACJEC8_01025 [Candidatus Carsonella ruddii]|uniref:hypothetical protein n=1 Tax=Carsonella ruddii TaxID=114186 RepID=UPI003D9A4C55